MISLPLHFFFNFLLELFLLFIFLIIINFFDYLCEQEAAADLLQQHKQPKQLAQEFLASNWTACESEEDL